MLLVKICDQYSRRSREREREKLKLKWKELEEIESRKRLRLQRKGESSPSWPLFSADLHSLILIFSNPYDTIFFRYLWLWWKIQSIALSHVQLCCFSISQDQTSQTTPNVQIFLSSLDPRFKDVTRTRSGDRLVPSPYNVCTNCTKSYWQVQVCFFGFNHWQLLSVRLTFAHFDQATTFSTHHQLHLFAIFHPSPYTTTHHHWHPFGPPLPAFQPTACSRFFFGLFSLYQLIYYS